ncbi:hypothetical protein H0264_28515 [Nocardia huaxiensis]|uniref:Uncharacterized protein n=1 Tax=Nocardia huaxiensis TaxID=2755382 RepID=A0A7D6ZJG3_9NOCA|nr:hypothetical protein [Nocardia huaxiensis]QLY29203.1 hypothetical protein H0264_28515 [Nocardia huaxiensis]
MNADPNTPETRPIPSTAEQLDEDALDADPLEEAADPPEAWTPTGEEAAPPESASETARRLAAEEPDIG